MMTVTYSFQGARLVGKSFYGLSFEGVDFSGSILVKVHFERCRLVGTSFRGAFLRRITTTNCEVANLDLEEADLDDQSRRALGLDP